ncbi:hypothetical protein S83_057396, partial [Arachis hypogaea]
LRCETSQLSSCFFVRWNSGPATTPTRESHALPRLRADAHPLSAAPSPPLPQGDVVESGNSDFFDPLRGTDNEAKVESPDPDNLSNAVDHHPTKEWTSFRRLLMQKFPVTKMVSMSSKSSTIMHLEELDDPQKFADEGVKVITWQEYVSRLHELKDEINRSWLAEDHIMDMLGELVWQRIKRKAEFTEDGALLCNLAENFKASDICSDAKETCNNWFNKIGVVQELLSRM